MPSISASGNSSNNFILASCIIGFCAAASIVIVSIFAGPSDGIQIKNADESEIKAERNIQEALSAASLDEPVQEKAPVLNLEGFNKYKFTYTYSFDVNGYIKDLNLELPIPRTEAGKQYISDFTMKPEPSKILKKDGSTIAVYDIPSLSTGKFDVVFEGTAHVKTYSINSAAKINKNSEPETDLSRYLKPEEFIESTDASIIKAAESIQGSSRQEIVNNTYKFIHDRITYKAVPGTFGAKKALKNKWGKCSEYSALMTAILRAKNIPARIAEGHIARESNTPHNWTEVYYDEYGWVSYDPTAAPVVIEVYGADKKLKKKEKHYETSREDILYIKSGINLFNPFKFSYGLDKNKKGTVKINKDIKIRKAD